MIETMNDIMHPGMRAKKDLAFPHAPADWTRDAALERARAEGLELGEEHFDALRALQGYFARRGHGAAINVREVHDALEEKFHKKGGIRYLYQLFPGGPVAQGCRVAGLEAPAGAADKGFGSVV